MKSVNWKIVAWAAFVVWIINLIAALTGAGTHSPWDGTAWDIASPDIDQSIGDSYKEIYDLRKGVAIRINKEHTTLATSSAGGIHKNGSAVAYEGTTLPTNRPDGSTALADNAYDRGRLYLNDNYNPPLLQRWDGTALEDVATLSGGAAPMAYFHNTTEEDGDGGRESILRAYGEQSGGERTTLGYIEFSHDGTSDDQKGRFRVLLNDGDDANAPSKVAIEYASDGTIDVAGSVSVLDEDAMGSDSATKVATQQSIKAYVDNNTTDDTETDVSGKSWVIDEDDMSSDLDTKVPTQQSTKAYVDNEIDTAVAGSGFLKTCNVTPFNTTMTAAATMQDLDLSGTIGSAYALVYLEITASGACQYCCMQKGATGGWAYRVPGSPADIPYGTGYIDFVAGGHYANVIVMTNGNGVMLHGCSSGTVTITVRLTGYIK